MRQTMADSACVTPYKSAGFPADPRQFINESATATIFYQTAGISLAHNSAMPVPTFNLAILYPAVSDRSTVVIANESARPVFAMSGYIGIVNSKIGYGSTSTGTS